LAERAPKPYLALHPDDLAELGLTGGDTVRVNLSGEVRQLQVMVLPSLARGLAGLPVGLPDLPWFDATAQFWECEQAAAMQPER
jgi:NADH-quinone oxidoreductase subunit G